MTLSDLERRVARLERQFERVAVVAPNPLALLTGEAFALGHDGQPLADTVQVMPFPGCYVRVPATSQIIVAYVRPGQDPVLIAGAPTVAAMAAIGALMATLPPTGAIVLADPVAGTAGLTISTLGVDLFGVVTVNGAPIPGV